MLWRSQWRLTKRLVAVVDSSAAFHTRPSPNGEERLPEYEVIWSISTRHGKSLSVARREACVSAAKGVRRLAVSGGACGSASHPGCDSREIVAANLRTSRSG